LVLISPPAYTNEPIIKTDRNNKQTNKQTSHNEAGPIGISRVFDFIAGYEIGEMEDWGYEKDSLMPLHFFFCFLYYTDAASTCLVLLMC
jgi:hypothetical protein